MVWLRFVLFRINFYYAIQIYMLELYTTDGRWTREQQFVPVLIFYDVGLLRPGIELTQERRCNRMGTATGNVGYCERLYWLQPSYILTNHNAYTFTFNLTYFICTTFCGDFNCSIPNAPSLVRVYWLGPGSKGFVW